MILQLTIIYFIIGKVKKKVTALLRKVAVFSHNISVGMGSVYRTCFHAPLLYEVAGMG